MLSLFHGGAGRKQLYKLAYVAPHGTICNQVEMRLFFLFFFFSDSKSCLKIPNVIPGEAGEKGHMSQNTARE